jgi:glycosyltransferase involved in cell wall biosynthesis
MISVVIPCLNAQETLPRCFDSLITATVHGIVREVIVADGGSTDDSLIIADAAGARIAHGGKSRVSQLQAGAACVRGDWILFLYPEIALSPGWEVEAGTFMSHVSYAKPFVAAFHFSLEEFDSESRRAETYAAVRSALFKLPFGEQGLLIPRKFYDQIGGYRDVAMSDADMARRIGAGRLVILRARAVCQTQTRPATKSRPLLTALYALRLPPNLLAKID